MSGIALWERREKETPKAFAAFVEYRDQPAKDRSIRAAARDTDGSEQQFTRWSTKHDWIVRAGAYDDYIDEHKRAANLDVIDEMADRQAEAAMLMQNIAIDSLKRTAEDMEINPDLRIKEGNIMHFLTQGAAMERIARGESGDISEQLTGEIIVIWDGPPIDGEDATDASGPEESPTG